MHQKCLNFLYYKNQFKLIVYTLKIISLFDKNMKNKFLFTIFLRKEKLNTKKMN